MINYVATFSAQIKELELAAQEHVDKCSLPADFAHRALHIALLRNSYICGAIQGLQVARNTKPVEL